MVLLNKVHCKFVIYIIVHTESEEIIPNGGGCPVTAVNLGDTVYTSDATTASNSPKVLPLKSISNHEFLCSNHWNAPTPIPNFASTP